jgi:DNA polymerase-1
MDTVVDQVSTMQKAALRQIPEEVLNRHIGKERLTRSRLVIDTLFSTEEEGGFGLRPYSLTKGGAPSTDRKSLMRIRDDLPEGHPAFNFLSDYIAWGPFNKLLTTYIGSSADKGFGRHIKRDGRLHPSVSMTRTATDRTGLTDPPLQTIPKRNPLIANAIRSLLVAPPGRVLITIDYSQSELRWFGRIGNIKDFIKIFQEHGDIHTETGRSLVHNPWDSYTAKEKKDARQRAKAVAFGLIYGMMAKKFQAYARDEYGIVLTIEEAERYRDIFLTEKYPDIPIYHAWQIEFAQKNGYVRSPYGFIRWMPNINSDDFMARSEDERAALNTPTQNASTCSTLLAAKIAMDKGIIDGKKNLLCLTIHDELVLEAPEVGHEQVAQDVVDCMIHEIPKALKKDFNYELGVPLEAESKAGYNLADMHEIIIK